MTMVSSGPISLGGTATSGGLNQSINVELGYSGTAQISLNDAAVRTLLGVSSGAISLNDAYGKTNRAAPSQTYSSNQTNVSLNITTLSGYIAGKSDVTITINTGVYVYSTATGTPALTLSGGSTGDTITIVNKGYILGMGGAGARPVSGNVQNGNPAGNAISLGFNTTINNTNSSAYIAGGGGGGASGKTAGSGGGAGGGAGGAAGPTGSPAGVGGAGGGPGSAGADGFPAVVVSKGTDYYGSGGGGGRVLPGTGGAGGSGFPNVNNTYGRGGGSGGGGGCAGASGGNGGSSNSAGSNSPSNVNGGGGGGWGASGGNAGGSGTAGAGGKAVSLNGYTVTWTSGDTTRVYGAVS